MKSRWLGKGAKVLLGLGLGLALAEWLFVIRDSGAFPHLNFYEPDALLGTRLAPHAHMKLSFSGNPVTEVHTNALGFRGAEWPAPERGRNDVLVVGDSQVFGLGVDDDRTFSAQLEKQLGGARVLNAGVPTYGPLEYTALVERWIRERKPAKVVYVLNLANDLFEIDRPNRERHAVWDGWAVRKETAPSGVLQFPGRKWLMSQSHAMFALRGVLRGSTADDAQFASEGTWRELVSRGRQTPVDSAPNEASVRGAIAQSRELGSRLERLDVYIIDHFAGRAVSDRRYVAAMRRLGQAQGDPRDIVSRGLSEESRPTFSAAFQLLYAALALSKNDRQLVELAQSTRDTGFQEILNERTELRRKLAELSKQVADPRERNALDVILERTLAACKHANAELLVAILPLDVQVSSAEWAKYGQTPIDLEPTRALADDIAERAARLGVRSLDLTPALRAAEPGAFLLGDIHMSAKGHAAVASALPAAFAAAAPQRTAFPAGRSLLPAQDEWQAIEPLRPVNPENTAEDRCEVKSLREWVHIGCRDDANDAAKSVTLLKGGRGDAVAGVVDPLYGAARRAFGGETRWSLELLVPVLPGDQVEASFGWARHTHHIRIERRSSEAPLVTFSAREPATDATGVTPKRIQSELEPSLSRDPRCYERVQRSLEELGPAAGFEARYRMLATCELGQRQRCPQGEFDFGALGRCVPECHGAAQCPGECVAWNGRFGCVER